MEKLLISIFVAVESAHAFSAFCPSVFTIRTFVDTPEKKRDLRLGYAPAAIFAIVLSFVVSRMIKSNLPLFFGVATLIFMIMSYELALMGV